MRKRVWLVVWLLLVLAMGSEAVAQTVVKMGSLNDLTGPTSDVGKDIALGMREAVQYVNDTGGINGKPIKLFLYDYGYRVPEAITTYKRFRDFDKVVAVWGWGTGDTEALSPTVNADKMVYLSHSFSSHLTDPKKTPYNFVYGTDYSSNARAALTAWYDEVWLKDPKFKADREKGVKPRFVAFYGWPVPYASAPIKAIKDQAKLLGIEVGPDQDIPLTALDTKSQVLSAKNFGPHIVWHGNTTMSVATAIRDAHALGLGADHIVNNWGYDENLIKLAGPASERVMGAAVNAFFGEKVPLMEKVMEYAKRMNPGVPLENRLIRTVQSWVDVLMMREALVRADKAGKLNGPGVKEAFETLREWTPGLGRPPVTITPTDHRPGSLVRVYMIKDKKFNLVKEVDLKKRWPDKWEKEWLGW
ncbi:MAG: ABC transporter substrate-binding protein [candidate division NC10 bacterium]|nr:ABC transporter substrate-binding protein [candidate division NC10 bacterium]MBI2114211.1 ABC transporter substrate-binding protein [candidate division NC10 bacterium]MBI2561688.1 ABC transporter substrate-binding protein [candidate division NC10 bacterium]